MIGKTLNNYQHAVDMRRFGRRVIEPPWGPNDQQNQDGGNGAYIGIGAIILGAIIIGVLADNNVFGLGNGWLVIGVIGMFLFLVPYGIFLLWFSKVEEDDLREVDLKVLTAQAGALYLRSDETLQQNLLKNVAGVQTENWEVSHIVEREHTNGRSWVFDNDGNMGETAILVHFAHQTFPDTLIAYGLKPLETSLRKSDISNRRVLNGQLNDERLRLGYRQITTFIRKMDGKQIMVYGRPNENTLVQKWVDANLELGQITNMLEFHNLAISSSYALLHFERELPADKETFSTLELRINQLLELGGGTYEKTPDKAADEIQKLKDGEKGN